MYFVLLYGKSWRNNWILVGTSITFFGIRRLFSLFVSEDKE